MSTVQVGPRATIAPPRPPQAVPERAPDSAPLSVPRLRRYSFEIPISPELLPFLALMGIALGMRLWDLGDKALHHDESLHAVYSWYLYQGRGYVHDPMMHGPLLFIGNALTYFLFGASDFTARLVPALLGVAVVGLPWFLRHEMGHWGAVAASLLFTISPSFLYFSRFLRHDIYVDAFTLVMVIGVFRYLATGRIRWFYTAVAGAALLFATKEDVYISGFIAFLFLVGCWFLLTGERRALYRARVRALGLSTWLWGVAVFLAINLVLYTTFFTNPRGICTALVTLPINSCSGAQGALSYWFAQQDYARGGQPWFYYLMLLPLYELLPLALGLLSLRLVRAKNPFYWFTAFWFVAALGIYSWAGEKMPWMLPQIALPLILLAGRLLGQWAEAGWGRRALSGRGLAIGGLVLLAALSIVSWVGLGAAQSVAPIDQQTVTLQRLALSVVIAGVAGGLVALGSRWRGEYLKPGLALGLLAIFGAGYLRVALMVSYDHPDTPTEPLIYVQSSHDVVWVSQEIARVADQTGQGKDLKILMDNGWGDGTHEAVAWPFEWYLRDYKNRTYFTKTIDSSKNPNDYPVVLAMATNVDPIQDFLKSYNGQMYRLNWWFPEDYKQFAGGGPSFTIAGKKVDVPWLRFDLIGQTLSNPQNRAGLLKFLFLREAPGTMGAREFYFYVNKQVPQVGPSPIGGRSNQDQAAPPIPSGPRQAVAQPQSDGSVIYGRAADGSPMLADPKDVAFGPNGRFYAIEGRGTRVTAFNPDGSIATSWGSPGQGDGQFQEPWGIAVAPNGDVYVADTWNHRVQYFDPNGKFLGKWGQLGDAKGSTADQPGIFWGPRSIAISPQGEVFVTDTGNKRVQVFSLDGKFLRMFGGQGSQPGQLVEPVGIALDPQGDVWVADAWNKRVQELDPKGGPIAQFVMPPGWENQSIANKPYVAVDKQGRVVATFPDQGHAMVITPDGQTVSELQVPSGGTAVGVAIGPDGRAYIADAKSGDVVSFALP